MKILCLATLVALCSFAQNGQLEFEKAKEFEKKSLYTEAVSWYRKAAEQGDAESQYNLGVCYAKGYGVIENREQAIYWLLKATAQNHEIAIKLLEILY